MVGWHHQLVGHDLEQAPGVGDREGSLACCRPWDHRESDRTERLNWLTGKKMTLFPDHCGKVLMLHHRYLFINENIYNRAFSIFLCGFSTIRHQYKAVYCHPAYLTYVQSTSCEMPGWMKHKLESRLPGEISIISDTQRTPPLWQKVKRRVKNLA